MADNTDIKNAAGGTESIADDEITDGGVANGAKVQRAKAGFGPDGAYTDVQRTVGLPTDGSYTELTGTFRLETSADVDVYDGTGVAIASTDVAGKTSWFIQYSIQDFYPAVECSVDGVDWFPVQFDTEGSNVDSNKTMAYGPLFGRYVRVRASGLGTAFAPATDYPATLVLTTAPATVVMQPPNYPVPVNANITNTTLPLSLPDDAGWTHGFTGTETGTTLALGGYNSVTVEVIGTFTGTVSLIAWDNDPSAAVPLTLYNVATGSPVSTVTGTGALQKVTLAGPALGLQFVQANGAVTSGAANVTLYCSRAVSPYVKTSLAGTMSVDDGGGSLTVDGTVGVSGTVTVDGSGHTQPVSGTVAVSNLPATQPVSGTVAVSNFPATQAVSLSGVLHVDDNAGSLTVDDGGGSLTVDGSVSITGTPAVTVSGTATVDTELPPAAALADAAANPTAPTIGAADLVFDSTGGTWYRRLNAKSASGAAVGTQGVPAAAALGSDGTSFRVLKTDTAGSPVPSSLMISGSTMAGTNAIGVASTDVSGFGRFALQLTGTWTGNVQVQGCNDNTNWTALPFGAVGQPGPNTVLTSATSGSGLYVGTVVGRYIRVIMTTYSSGTGAVPTLELLSTPGDVNVIATLVGYDGTNYQRVQTNGSGALSVNLLSGGSVGITGTATVDTELPAAVALADGTANPTVPAVAGYGMAYNATNWERLRTASGASSGTGTGLLGVGLYGYDGSTNYYRLKVDTTGVLYTGANVFDGANYNRAKGDTDGTAAVVSRAGTGTVTSVASSATAVTLLAQNTARKGAMVYNESTAVLYLRLSTGASVTAYTLQIAPGGYYELPQPAYTGLISGIWASANGNARITELT